MPLAHPFYLLWHRFTVAHRDLTSDAIAKLSLYGNFRASSFELCSPSHKEVNAIMRLKSFTNAKHFLMTHGRRESLQQYADMSENHLIDRHEVCLNCLHVFMQKHRLLDRSLTLSGSDKRTERRNGSTDIRKIIRSRVLTQNLPVLRHAAPAGR